KQRLETTTCNHEESRKREPKELDAPSASRTSLIRGVYSLAVDRKTDGPQP
ncbi:hypothetical protein K0M31_018756, partial [Melipona bicolor]